MLDDYTFEKNMKADIPEIDPLTRQLHQSVRRLESINKDSKEISVKIIVKTKKRKKKK